MKTGQEVKDPQIVKTFGANLEWTGRPRRLRRGTTAGGPGDQPPTTQLVERYGQADASADPLALIAEALDDALSGRRPKW
jgi:hypothetical protein